MVLEDVYLEGEWAFSNEFRFSFFIVWPEDIKKSTIKVKKKYSKFISINFIEFVIIIIACNEVLDAIELLGYYTQVLYSKALIESYNTLATS